MCNYSNIIPAQLGMAHYHTYIPEALISSMSEEQVQQSVVLKPDTTAPDFTLHSTPDQSVSLGQLRGNPTILAFYPADFSPVCGDQMTLYNQVLHEFQRFNAEQIGISVFSPVIIVIEVEIDRAFECFRAVKLNYSVTARLTSIEQNLVPAK